MKLHNTLAALTLCLPLALAAQPAAALESGRDYMVLNPAQMPETKGKVEVVEFFAYTCPHCFELEPDLNAWARKLPKDVVLKRVPAVFSEKWEPMARAYYALEALGLLEKMHGDVFNAIHVDEKDITSAEAFLDWAAKRGVNRARLSDAFNSFGVAAKVARAKQMSKAYRLTGVPALAVGGKYLTSASMTGSHQKALEAVDALIAMERRGR